MYLPVVGLVDSFEYLETGKVSFKPTSFLRTNKTDLQISEAGDWGYKYKLTLSYSNSVEALLDPPLFPLDKLAAVYIAFDYYDGLLFCRGYLLGFHPLAQQVSGYDLSNHSTGIQTPKEFVTEISGIDLVPYREYYAHVTLSVEHLKRFTNE